MGCKVGKDINNNYKNYTYQPLEIYQFQENYQNVKKVNSRNIMHIFEKIKEFDSKILTKLPRINTYILNY